LGGQLDSLNDQLFQWCTNTGCGVFFATIDGFALGIYDDLGILGTSLWNQAVSFVTDAAANKAFNSVTDNDTLGFGNPLLLAHEATTDVNIFRQLTNPMQAVLNKPIGTYTYNDPFNWNQLSQQSPNIQNGPR
jgi:hypothetical protein